MHVCMGIDALKLRRSRSGTSGGHTEYAQQVSSSHAFNSVDCHSNNGTPADLVSSAQTERRGRRAPLRDQLTSFSKLLSATRSSLPARRPCTAACPSAALLRGS